MNPNRWDAAQEWLNRKYSTRKSKDRCDGCRTETSRSTKAACWRTARHVAYVYGLNDIEGYYLAASALRNAAYVLQRIQRKRIAPIEHEIERMLNVRARLKPKMHRGDNGRAIGSKQLLSLINRLLKAHADNQN